MTKNHRMLIIAPLFLILAGSGFVARQAWQATPGYALGQMQEAIKEKSRLRFERFVDVDGLSEAVVEEVFAKATMTQLKEQEAADVSGFGVLGALIGAQAIDKLKPGLRQELRQNLLKAVESGRMDSLFTEAKKTDVGEDKNEDKKTLTLMAMARNVGADEMKFAGLGEIEREGDVATVALRFRSEVLDTTLVLRLRMQQQEGQWRINRPDNLPEYLDQVRELQQAKVTWANQRVRAMLDDAVEIGPLKRWVESRGWYSEVLWMEVPIRNKSGQPVDSMLIRMHEDDEALSRGAMVRVGRLAPDEQAKAIGVMDYYASIDLHRKVRSSNDLVPKLTYAVFFKPDGKRTTITAFESWDDFLRRRDETGL